MSSEPLRRECAPLDWYATLEGLRGEGFAFFDFLTAVDQTDAEEDPGFEIIVHLYDMGSPAALRSVLVRTRIADGAPLPSVTTLWRGAAWHERETHEMFGIAFTGFEDGSRLGVRPLLLPEGFEGHPLRKSFVLAARVSKPWPGAKDPGESGDSPAPKRGRRKNLPPGVPDSSWGPR
ncbi:NADH-quinone oxidoreductase subunit C [Demetria terragena]|uniref:NADH-quinone oxidoreductase subunit C n=1 Tax=Demetria terragena TaxID=63959 RepID=UPI000376661F|nr:NADH-quinone oxidoreductase subunit C [Demetria terragena]